MEAEGILVDDLWVFRTEAGTEVWIEGESFIRIG